MEEENKTSTKKRTTKPKTTSNSTKKVSKTKKKETPKKSVYDIWMNIITCMETFYQNHVNSKTDMKKYKNEVTKYTIGNSLTTGAGLYILISAIVNGFKNGIKYYDYMFIILAIGFLICKHIVFRMLMGAITGGHKDFYNNEQYKNLKTWVELPFFKDVDFKKLLECMYFCVYFNQLYPDKLQKIKETNLYKSTRSLTIDELEEVVRRGQFNEGLTKEDYKICAYYLLCRPEISLINMILSNPLFIQTRDWHNTYSYSEKKTLTNDDCEIIHNMTLTDDIEQIGIEPEFTEANKYDFHSYFGIGISAFDKMLKLHLPEFKERVNKSYENNINSSFGMIIRAYNKASKVSKEEESKAK